MATVAFLDHDLRNARAHPRAATPGQTGSPMIPSLNRRPRWLFAASAIGILAIIGGFDYLTGHEIMFSTFYLLPVAVAAWTVGRKFAVLVSALSVGTWLVGDLAAGATYPQPFVPVWNAGIVFGFYLVVVYLLGRLHGMQRDLEDRVRDRTRDLTEEMAERERLERELLEVGERERRRIGRDLHDSLGQLLTGTALACQVHHEKLSSRNVPDSADAARIVRLIEEAIELTRGLARGLDPVEIEGGGLAQGLRELATNTSRLSATRCEYTSNGDISIGDSVTATHLYRIAQEAITNAIKHGRADRIVLGLVALPGRVRLTVRDDGAGLPEGDRRGQGMGLRIMAHRAAVMGGSFEVRRMASGGTMVTCEMSNP